MYTFEAWYKPPPYFTLFSQLIEDFPGQYNNTLFHNAILDFQPILDLSCAAIWCVDSMILQWISIPCDMATHVASYICEIKSNQTNNQNLRTGPYSNIIHREILECPPNTTYIASSCVTVRTVETTMTRVDSLPNRCGKDSEPLKPQGIFYKWQDVNRYFAETMRLFYLRWPSLYDYETIADKWTDEIMIFELAMHGGSDTVAIEFSKSSSFNMEFRIFNEPLSEDNTHVLDIACGVAPKLANNRCMAGHYQCTDGTCILEHYVCDGHANCPYVSDETDCSHVCSLYASLNIGGGDCYTACMPEDCVCHQLYFQCQGGGCVAWSRVCDGVTDCTRSEDELLCSFYQSKNTSNVTITQKTGNPVIIFDNTNNKTPNSYGAHVPEGYENKSSSMTSIPEYKDFVLTGSRLNYFEETLLCPQSEETTCVKNFYGECYPRHRHCIFEPASKIGCRNGLHLKSCFLHSCPNFFKCPDDYCLPFHLICNGVPDCPNGEDEKECEHISCPGFLLCSLDRLCVHPHEVWTGHT